MAKEIQELLRVKRNQIEMIRDRGFDITEEASILDPNFGIRQFDDAFSERAEELKSFRSAMSRIYFNQTTGKEIVVYYAVASDGKDVKVAVVDQFLEFMNSSGKNTAIYITDKPLGAQSKSRFEDKPALEIWHFTDSQLAFNITKHVLNSQYRALTREENTKFYATSKILPGQLPVLSLSDPNVRWFGWKRGQIVEIKREKLSTTSLVQNELFKRIVL